MDDNSREINRAVNTLGVRTDLRLSMLILAQESGHFLTGNQITDELRAAGSVTFNGSTAADIARIIAPSGLLLRKHILTDTGITEAYAISSTGIENGVPVASALCSWELKFPNLLLSDLLDTDIEPSVTTRIYKAILDCGDNGLSLPNYQQLIASLTGKSALSKLVGIKLEATTDPTERKLYLTDTRTKPLNVRAEVKAADTIARELISMSIYRIHGADLLEAINNRYPHFNKSEVWKKILGNIATGKLIIIEDAPLKEYNREQIRVTIRGDYLKPITVLINSMDQLINDEEYRQKAIKIGKNIVKNKAKITQLLNGAK